MQSNKVVCITNLFFNLPDDFTGTLTDALEEIVRYRRSKEAITNRKIDDEIIYTDKPEDIDEALCRFWNDDNIKLAMSAGISYYENGQWIVQDKKNLI